MENMQKDARYAWRQLIKSPGFTVVAVLALGLGIGANTAIFSVFNGILWRPLPVPNHQQLVSVSMQTPGAAFPMQLSYPDIQAYAKLNNVFSGLIGYAP